MSELLYYLPVAWVLSGLFTATCITFRQWSWGGDVTLGGLISVYFWFTIAGLLGAAVLLGVWVFEYWERLNRIVLIKGKR